ncbi:MAG TPA: alpha/beta fold hydrolase [Nitrososphaeraceae archaeon]|nr:alpha/beta fold hydrolase [Nitrososphaeraceae archaeon]
MVNTKFIIAIAIAVAAIAIGVAASASLVYRPPEASTGGGNPSSPVLLVHGLGEDASMWKKWEELLTNDGIQYHTITFQESDDKCGTALSHAVELGKRVDEILSNNPSGQVNIVGHSKGGIDARVYLANGTLSVANLIMIGTPNNGTPMAERTSLCAPAVWDTLPEANATKVGMNPNTRYYTIAGDWAKEVGGNPTISGPDDGLVPLSSAESGGNFQSLGRTEHAHLELLGEEEYNLAREVLLGRR